MYDFNEFWPEPPIDPTKERYQLENSDEVLVNVHRREDCQGPVCCIHKKTDHHMRSWPQHWRSDRGIMERVNPFGGACPDPDQALDDWEWIHGCIVNPAFPSRGICSKWYINGVEAAWINEAYAITKDGKVWSYLKSTGPVNGNVCIPQYDEPPHELKQKDNGRGYLTVQLRHGFNKKYSYVHRLVLMAWYGEPAPGQDTRHLNGNRKDNRLSNLSWGTRAEQEQDQILHGTKPRGNSHKNSVLTLDQVNAARRLWRSGYTLKDINRILSLTVSKATVHDAVIGKTWRHAEELPMKKTASA